MTDFSKLNDKEIDLMLKLNLDKKKEADDLLRNLSKTDEKEVAEDKKEENLDEQDEENEENDEKDGSSEEETTE